MATRTLTVVCAWCHRILAVAPVDSGITHTICESCFDWTLTHPAAAEALDAIQFPPRGRELFAEFKNSALENFLLRPSARSFAAPRFPVREWRV